MKQDEELLEAWLAREDRAALDELFGRHYPGVYQVVLRIVHDETDARDVAQATFLKALRKAATVRRRDRFRYWLLRIAVNEARQHHRRARPTVSLDDLAVVFAEARRAAVVQEAGRREFEIELERALETMPETLKTPLVLHYYQSLSLAEVARVLELPKSTVQSRCERAVALLRTRFARSRHTALVPLLAARFPDLAASGTSATANAAAGALAVKSWILVVAAVLLAALLVAGTAGLFDPDPEGLTRGVETMARGGAEEAGAIGPTQPGLDVTNTPTASSDSGPDAPRTHVVTSGPGAITGRVVALATGHGIAGAVVRLTPSIRHGARWAREGDEGWFENAYVTDTDGRFTCDGLPVPSSCDLWVTRRGFGYGERFAVGVSESDRKVDLGVVFLRDGKALEGRVLDTDGRPVHGARVSAGTWREADSPLAFRLAGYALRGARAETRPDGRFRLEGLAAGAHRLQVAAEGFATAVRAAVTVPADAGIDIVLRHRDATAVRVVDEDEEPVAGARVAVSISETRRRGSFGLVRQVSWTAGQSGGDGSFKLASLPGGDGFDVVLEVSHKAFHDLRRQVPVPEGGLISLTLRRRIAPRGVTVRVRPLPEVGMMPRDAVGEITLSAQDVGDELSARLDPRQGVFVLPAVPPGRWYARALVCGFVPATAELAIGSSDREHVLPLVRGQVLEGRIIDDVTGEGVPGARVSWAHSRIHVATADESGRYRLEGLALEAGRTYVGAFTARAPQHLTSAFSVEGADDGVTHRDVRLVPRSALRTVRGHVLDEAGAPVIGARVDLQVNDGRGTWHAAHSDVRGAFEIRGLDPSTLGPTVRLAVSHPRYAPLARRAPEAVEGGPIAVVLTRGRSLAGRVLDLGGAPVGSARVGFLPGDPQRVERVDDEYAAWNLSGALVRTATTDAQGRFRIERVPTGEGAVLVFHAHGRWVSSPGGGSYTAVAPEGDVEGLALRVEIGRRVRGTVVDTEGRPVAGALVRAEGVTVGTRTDARGRFDLTPVFRGGSSLTLTVRASAAKARLKAAVGDWEHLRVIVRPTGAVKGKVVDARGRAVPKAIVSLVAEDGTALGGGTTDATGAFTISDVYAGPARLDVRRRPGEETPAAVVAIDVLPGRASPAGEIRLH